METARMTNATYAKSDLFLEKCRTAYGVTETGELLRTSHRHMPLTRQASKFRRGMGFVYQKTVQAASFYAGKLCG